MTFSDWITITSILAAAMLAVFKFDEWDVIRLKNVGKYAWPPATFLFLGGVASYFHINPHPPGLDFFWTESGINSGVWPIIWLTIAAVSGVILWNKFIDQPPSERLLKQYAGYLKILDAAKFSAIFRKYERFFFRHVKSKEWLRYQTLFVIPRWWEVAPTYFRESIILHPERFFKMRSEVLITLLEVQFTTMDSEMMKELELPPREEKASEHAPVLNIFLNTAHSIELSRSRNILIPTVRDIVTEYFSSLEFIQGDEPILRLRPVGVSRKVIPVRLKVYYYINFIHWYWINVIRTRARVAGFYQYGFWTQSILAHAPVLDEDEMEASSPPNHYCLAIDLMLDNLHDWQRTLDHHEITTMRWASVNFIKQQLMIFEALAGSYHVTVPSKWYISQLTALMFDLISCRRMYGREFPASSILARYDLPKDHVVAALSEMTEQEFVTPGETQGSVYMWVLSLFGVTPDE